MRSNRLVPDVGVLAGWAAAGDKGWRGKANTDAGTGTAARLQGCTKVTFCHKGGSNINSQTYYGEKYPPVSLWDEISISTG